MSIDRNSYLSLIESVNEAVTGKTAKSAKTSAPARVTKASRVVSTSATAATKPASTTKPLEWGDARIGGAMNAMELAKWLNSLSEDSELNETDSIWLSGRTKVGGAKAPAKSVARTAKVTKVSTTAKPAQKSAGGGQGGGGSGLKWGDPSIGGAMNGYELAQWLNKQSQGTGVVLDAQAASVKNAATSGGTGLKEAVKAMKVSKPKAGKVSTTATAKTAATKATGGSVGGGLQWGDKSIGGAMNAQELAKWLNSQSTAGLKEDEDFDVIDEILAEGIELYGEEGLAEILADFEETGEISDELADLLGIE